MADHLADDEIEEFFREIGVEMRLVGQPPQPRDLLALARRVGGR
jgi:hypothetical protein